MSYADIPLGVECAWPTAPIHGASKVSRRGTPRLARIAFALALMVCVWHLGHAAYIAAKAELAQVLIGRAWQRTLAGGQAVKPWPWADTWPVARLAAPDHDVELFVLAGANGRSIAFGPGHVFGTASPGEPGNSAIGGHRDTHLRFLKDVKVGERFFVDRPDGQRVAYRVSNTRIVHKSAVEVLGQSGPDRLTLITCWPFDALRAGGPDRYVVEAVRDTGGTPARP